MFVVKLNKSARNQWICQSQDVGISASTRQSGEQFASHYSWSGSCCCNSYRCGIHCSEHGLSADGHAADVADSGVHVSKPLGFSSLWRRYRIADLSCDELFEMAERDSRVTARAILHCNMVQRSQLGS